MQQKFYKQDTTYNDKYSNKIQYTTTLRTTVNILTLKSTTVDKVQLKFRTTLANEMKTRRMNYFHFARQVSI